MRVGKSESANTFPAHQRFTPRAKRLSRCLDSRPAIPRANTRIHTPMMMVLTRTNAFRSGGMEMWWSSLCTSMARLSMENCGFCCTARVWAASSRFGYSTNAGPNGRLRVSAKDRSAIARTFMPTRYSRGNSTGAAVTVSVRVVPSSDDTCSGIAPSRASTPRIPPLLRATFCSGLSPPNHRSISDTDSNTQSCPIRNASKPT